MAKRSKRKAERGDERAGGNVIPLHGSRPEPATQDTAEPTEADASVERLSSDRPKEAQASRAVEPPTTGSELQHEDEHPEVRDFFARVEKPSFSTAEQAEQWADLEVVDHEHDSLHHRAHRRGMLWTLVIAGCGLLLISAFLVYNKLLMPTPEELGPGTVTIPTPDMLKNDTPARAEPVPAQEPVPQATPPVQGVPVPNQSALPAQQVAPLAPPPAVPADPGAASLEGAFAREPGSPSSGAPTLVVPSAPAQGTSLSALPGSAPQGEAPQPGDTVAPVLRSSEPPPTATEARRYDSLLAEARKRGVRRSAESAFLTALEVWPNGTEALSGLALLYLNQGKNLEARERAAQAVKADPNNAEAWIVLGAAEDALGRRVEARDAYSTCAALPASKYATECKRMLH